MASRLIHSAQRKAAKGSIDAPLAILAALSVGFVAFAMPVDILSRLVELSRLPDFVSAAQPPLGTKARAAFALAATIGTFAAVFLLLRMLGRPSAPRKAREQAEEPKLRRSDLHPDAPPRPPILAGRDLGEPEAALRPAPAPFWHPEDFPEEPDHHEEELELDGPGIEVVAEPEPEPEPEPTSQPLPEPQPVARDVADETIAEMIARLERGLARRIEQKQALARIEPAPRAPVRDEGEDRLRSAIENLQHMASRA